MVEYNPFDWETAHNPYPVYCRLRDEAPVYYNERLGCWALSRYDDVVAAHRGARAVRPAQRGRPARPAARR